MPCSRVNPVTLRTASRRPTLPTGRRSFRWLSHTCASRSHPIVRGVSRVGGSAFGDTARGSKLGHHTRYVVGVDVQKGLTAESVLDVPPVQFRFDELRVIGN